MDNPYQPLDQASTGSVVYRFDGVIAMSDILRMHRRARVTILLVIVPMSLMTLKIAYDSFRFGSNSGGGMLVVVTLLMWLLVYVTWRAAHRYAKAYPQIFEPIRGVLGTDFVEVETECVFHRLRSETIAVHAATKQFISFRPDIDRVLLPHMFSNYPEAMELALELKQQSKPLVSGDPRTREPVPVTEAYVGPDGSIPFAGEQHAGDYHVSDMKTRVRSVKLFLFKRLLLSLGIIALLFWIWDGRWIVIPAAFLVGIWFYKRSFKPMWPFLKTASAAKSEPEKTFWSMRGWLNEDCITLGSATGISRYKWSAFMESAMKDSESLFLFGQGHRFYLALHRRTFDSDERWEAATKLILDKVPKADA
jgi:hypothetical protein